MSYEYQTYTSTQDRFNDAAVASDYVKKKNLANTAKNRRELDCIQSALGNLSAGAKVLDLPCGSGRLGPMLLGRGFKVTAADYSQPMLDQAQHFLEEYYADDPEIDLNSISFCKQDIQNTSFQNHTFDAVICNRLFHHYPHAQTRKRVFKELKRICNGFIVVSYFSNASLSALKFHLRSFLSGNKAHDRIPIWEATLASDIHASGLHIVSRHPVRYGVSPQTYLRLEQS